MKYFSYNSITLPYIHVTQIYTPSEFPSPKILFLKWKPLCWTQTHLQEAVVKAWLETLRTIHILHQFLVSKINQQEGFGQNQNRERERERYPQRVQGKIPQSSSHLIFCNLIFISPTPFVSPPQNESRRTHSTSRLVVNRNRFMDVTTLKWVD